MKAALTLLLAGLLGVPAQAQLFRPEAVKGAIVGGAAGAVIGNNSGELGHSAGRGALVGAATGAVIGTAVGESRNHRERASYRRHDYRHHLDHHRSRTHVSIGFGHGWGHRHGWGHHHHGFRHHRGYGFHRSPIFYPAYRYPRYRYYEPLYVGYRGYGTYEPRSRALSGALLGGIAGAIIGNNSGGLDHDAWTGAAIGAGAGLVLGSLADRANDDATESVPVYVSPSAAQTVQPAEAAQRSAPQNVTIINNYYGNSAPMSSANRMFGR